MLMSQQTGKFRLNLTCLDLIASHARYKIYIKSNGVMPFLYGSNVLRAHLSKYSYVRHSLFSRPFH